MSEKVMELTESMLSGMMPSAMVDRGYATCIEDCLTDGIYRLSVGSYSAYPGPYPNWNFGWMEVITRGSDLLQRITHIDGGLTAFRVFRKGEWKSWYQYQLIRVT